jgi:hypothetical protein
MLRAMKEQLVYLVKEDRGQLKSLLIKRIGNKANEELEERLKRIIVLTPDLIARIYFYWSRSKTSSKTKILGGYILTTLYSPLDSYNQQDKIIVGYLSSAYLVAKFYTAIIDNVEERVLITHDDYAMYENSKFLKKAVREVMPQEALKTDLVLENILQGHESLYFDLIKPADIKG